MRLAVPIVLLALLAFPTACNTGTRESSKAKHGRPDFRVYNHSVWLHGNDHAWLFPWMVVELAESVMVAHDTVWTVAGPQALPERDIHVYGDVGTFLNQHQRRSNAGHWLPIHGWQSISGQAYGAYVDRLPDGSGDGSLHIQVPLLGRRTFLGFLAHMLLEAYLYKTVNPNQHPQVQWGFWNQEFTIASFLLFSQRTP